MLLQKAGRLLSFAFLAFLLGAAPARAAHFLWSVTGPGGNQAYLMGSIHLANPALYPLDQAIINAYSRSHNLAVELNSLTLNPEEVNALVTRHGLYPAGDSVENHLGQETLALLKGNAHYNPAGRQMKPWLLAVTLNVLSLQSLGYSEEYGLDRYFLKEAMAKKQKIFEMETMGQQLNILWEMTEAEAELFLRESLAEAADLPRMMDDFLSSWKNGDADGFARVFFHEYDKFPELTPVLDKLIFQRNQHMLGFIESLLRRRGEVTFIIVGAGHLVGPRGLLAELAAKGYRLEQL